MQREEIINEETLQRVLAAVYEGAPIVFQAYSYFDKESLSFPTLKDFQAYIFDEQTTGRHWLNLVLHYPETKGFIVKKKIDLRFVALVFQKQPVPKRLLKCFLQAAILEENPSLNRYFVEPCVRSWGWTAVSQHLLQYLQTGSDAEKAGAASAFYWVHENPRNEDISALKKRIRSTMLREFVSSKSTYVKQRIIPVLTFDSSLYPPEDHDLLPNAIAIARASSDHYIAHRIEVQLANGGPLQPIPTTKPE